MPRPQVASLPSSARRRRAAFSDMSRGTPLGTADEVDWTGTVSVCVYAFYIYVCQNLVPLVNIKIAGTWMFIPLKMVLIGIDPYPHSHGKSSFLIGKLSISMGHFP